MKFSALNVDFNGAKIDPLFKESAVREHQIWVPPSKRAVSATVVQSSKRSVADRHRLAAYHNKHCWRAFRGYDLEPPKYGVLVNFFAIPGWQTTYKIKLMLSRVSWQLAQISYADSHVTSGRSLSIVRWRQLPFAAEALS